MAIVLTWAQRQAAARIGVPPGDYVTNKAAGKLWCSNCHSWHDAKAFKTGQKSCAWSKALRMKQKRKGKP